MIKIITKGLTHNIKRKKKGNSIKEVKEEREGRKERKKRKKGRKKGRKEGRKGKEGKKGRKKGRNFLTIEVVEYSALLGMRKTAPPRGPVRN